MAYELDAVIAADEAARSVAFTLGRPAVRLHGPLALIPLDDADGDPIDPGRLVTALRRASQRGAVAHVRADLSGGKGLQSATLYRNGERIWDRPLGPFVDDEHTPISRALSALGVQAPGDGDEFGEVGLGRHRTTESWRSEPVVAQYHAR